MTQDKNMNGLALISLTILVYINARIKAAQPSDYLVVNKYWLVVIVYKTDNN